MEGVVVDPVFWQGKRVFLTGHTGFKGSWLALWLELLGAEVTGYSNGLLPAPSHFELARVGDGMRTVTGDVRDLDRLREALRESGAEIVFHMAAQSLVRRSLADPVETYETNVMGTVNLLEAVRQSPSVTAVVNVTSDKCYENREWEWGYREDDPKGGRDPYSSSKGCAELVTAAYRESFLEGGGGDGAAVASARAGNVIGGGDWSEDRLIPDLVRAALDGRPAAVRNPGAIRPWQHVLNPLSGYLVLAERLSESRDFACGWNFGPDDRDARSVRWVAERLGELWGEGLDWAPDGRAHPPEAMYLKVDSSRARLRLGWAPRWGLERALSSVVDWYRAYSAGADTRDVSVSQIRAHQEAGALS